LIFINPFSNENIQKSYKNIVLIIPKNWIQYFYKQIVYIWFGRMEWYTNAPYAGTSQFWDVMNMNFIVLNVAGILKLPKWWYIKSYFESVAFSEEKQI